MAGMRVTEETRGSWHIVSVEGRLDNATADPLVAVLLAAVGAHPQVAIDCSAVDYISSAGFGCLLDGARAARTAAREFRVCTPSARVKRMLEITHLNDVLNVHPALPC